MYLAALPNPGVWFGQCQVVIDCLRHTKEFLCLSCQDRIVRKFLDRVHGIVSANIDKCINVKTVQYIKDSLIDSLIFMDLRKFKTAGSQKSGWCSLEEFDIQF